VCVCARTKVEIGKKLDKPNKYYIYIFRHRVYIYHLTHTYILFYFFMFIYVFVTGYTCRDRLQGGGHRLVCVYIYIYIGVYVRVYIIYILASGFYFYGTTRPIPCPY